MVYNPPVAHYSHIDVSHVSPSVMEEIMGYKGAYFKAFTQAMKLKYVWWNKVNKVIELWGPYEHMLESQSVMLQRVDELVTNAPHVESDSTEQTIPDADVGAVE